MVAADVTESTSALAAPAEDDSKKSDRRAFLAFLALLLVAVVVIWLLLSRMIVVPDVVGMTEDDARAVLTEAGFVVGEVDEATAEDAAAVSAGEVAAQEPSGGSRAFRGTEIDLSVALAGGGDGSTGAGGLPDGSTGGYTGGSGYGPADGDDDDADIDVAAVDTRPIVPTVQNMTKSAALSALKSAGYVGVIGGYGPTTAGVLEGHVYYQNPPPYTRASSGSKVVIWISTGAPHEDGYEGVPYPGPP